MKNPLQYEIIKPKEQAEDTRDAISKSWGGTSFTKFCRKYKDGRHWAFYAFDGDKSYWLDEHTDEENKAIWRHHEFMSIPCRCGVYSPLRASTQFHGGMDENDSCAVDSIIDYHPDGNLPDTLAYYRENGWTYIYFRKTLSDSLDGQQTFRLKRDPSELAGEVPQVQFGT